MRNPRRRRLARVAVPSLVAAAAVGLAQTASAVDHFWDLPGEGNWTEPTNWNPDTLPSGPGNENAFINNGGTAVIDAAQGHVSTGALILGSLAGESGTFRITGGSLTTTNTDIRVGGNNNAAAAPAQGTGRIDQSGGEIRMNAGNINIGFGNSGVGTYDLSGGSLLVNSGAIFAVGNRATGTVNQTGGSVYVRGAAYNLSPIPQSQLNLGRNATSIAASGTYTLSGGDVTVALLRFGNTRQADTNTTASNNVFNLQGTGRLVVGDISIANTGLAATNTFNWTGGTLVTNTVNMPLTNNGGTLSPASLNFGVGANQQPQNAADVVTSQVGVTTFSGSNSYTQTSAGTLRVDVGSAGADQVNVGGAANLGGQLQVRNEDTFNPSPLNRYDVVTAASRTGTFSSVTGNRAADGLYYAAIYDQTGPGQNAPGVTLVATIGGDADVDGDVDVADLGILATNYNDQSATWTEGNFTGDAAVNVSDLGILATNYGRDVGGQAQFSGPATFAQAMALPQFAEFAAAVPEPGSLAVLSLAGLGLLARRRR